MKAILVILIFGIVFLALFANSKNSKENAKNFYFVRKTNTLTVREQSFFAINPNSQIRNQIEFWEDPIKIPEPIH
ncbi:MAG: hypothetical protein GXO79_07290 [Chlorobi bacterium]|nr:hypothetical protein [Chlorobiota bacterium]